jgi:hypothetical protein
LVPEKADPAQVMRLEFAGQHPGTLEGLDDRQVSVGNEPVQCRGDLRV